MKWSSRSERKTKASATGRNGSRVAARAGIRAPGTRMGCMPQCGGERGRSGDRLFRKSAAFVKLLARATEAPASPLGGFDEVRGDPAFGPVGIAHAAPVPALALLHAAGVHQQGAGRQALEAGGGRAGS